MPITIVFNRDNYYLNYPLNLLSDLARERDIQVTGNVWKIAQQLFAYDQIDPSWISEVVRTVDIKTLNNSKLLVYGAYHGIKFCYRAFSLTRSEMVKVIELGLQLRNYSSTLPNALLATLRSASLDVLRFLASIYFEPFNLIKFLEREVLINIISTKDSSKLDLQLLNKYQRRYIRIVSSDFSSFLANLHGFSDDDEESWIQISRQAPHPLEKYIINFEAYNLDHLIDQFEIVVPFKYRDKLRQYFLTNLIFYKNCFPKPRVPIARITNKVLAVIPNQTRISYLLKLTDREIFDTIGLKPIYENRAHLITQINITFLIPTFFKILNNNGLINSINNETLSGSDVHETELNELIGFGYMHRFYTYEWSDLLNAFSQNEQTQAQEFRHPENLRLKFSDSEIKILLEFLYEERNNPLKTKTLKELTDKIEEVLDEKLNEIDSDKRFLAKLNKLTPEIKAKLKHYLEVIFQAGMYMRRWKGPGHPYPLRSETTKSETIPDLEVSEKLQEIISIQKELFPIREAYLLINKLPSCEYQADGSIEHGRIPFQHILTQVENGESCIRVASTIFIGTSYHYLRVLFREIIPGLKVRELDHIV